MHILYFNLSPHDNLTNFKFAPSYSLVITIKKLCIAMVGYHYIYVLFIFLYNILYYGSHVASLKI